MAHDWKAVALALGVDPTYKGSWPKIIAETIGATNAPGGSWPAKIAAHYGLSPADDYEELADVVYGLVGSSPYVAKASNTTDFASDTSHYASAA